jgi:hypothetical protein
LRASRPGHSSIVPPDRGWRPRGSAQAVETAADSVPVRPSGFVLGGRDEKGSRADPFHQEASRLGRLLPMVGAQKARVDVRITKLEPQVLGRVAIGESVAPTIPHPLQTHLQGRQQDHVVEPIRRGHRTERPQEPRPHDAVVDDVAVSAQSADSVAGLSRDPPPAAPATAPPTVGTGRVASAGARPAPVGGRSRRRSHGSCRACA